MIGGGSRSRRGVGLPLLLVLSLVLVLAFIGYHQLFQASHVNVEAFRGAWGQVALGLAESGVTELMHRAALDVSDPRQPLFHLMRREIFEGQDGGFTLDSSERLDVLPDLLRQSDAPGLRLEGSSARVAFQRQFEDLPYERYGQIRYRTRVSVAPARGANVVRDLEVAQGFKVVLATPPRPFDRPAVYVGDAWTVTDFEAANRLRERFIQQVETVAGHLEKARASAPAGLKPRYDRALALITRGDALRERAPALPETRPALLVGTGSDGQEYPLGGLDIAARLTEDEVPAGAAVRGEESAMLGLEAAPSSEPAHERLLEAAERALEAIQTPLNRIWAYAEGYRIIGAGESGYQDIVSEHRRLHADHWRRVAGFALSDADGRSVQEQLDALRQRLGVLNGVVVLESPERPVMLSGPQPGKLVLVVMNGTVVLEGAGSGGDPSDLLTVVALGGTVELRGDVRAAVVLASLGGGEASGSSDSRIDVADGASIRGAFVAERIGPSSRLQGSLFRAETYYSGEGAASRTDRVAVLLSPRVTYRKVSYR